MQSDCDRPPSRRPGRWGFHNPRESTKAKGATESTRWDPQGNFLDGVPLKDEHGVVQQLSNYFASSSSLPP